MMEALQVIWFLLIGVLIIGYAILDGFDLGVGCWHLFAPEGDTRSRFIRSIEPFWDGNEVWLLTGGGALFAAFPPVYATLFSGYYLALMLVLAGLIFRAVAIEFRNKVESPRWAKSWDVAFALGSILPSLLFGVAVGNTLRGIELNPSGDYTAGFFALLNPFSLLCGVIGLAMFARHGALYLSMKLDGEIAGKTRRWAQLSGIAFMVLLIPVMIHGLLNSTYSGWIIPTLLGILALVAAALTCKFSARQRDGVAFIASAANIALTMLGVAAAIFPNLVPASNNPDFSLTVFNSSSSQLTLVSMLVIALIGVPVVLAYTIWIYRIFKGKVKA